MKSILFQQHGGLDVLEYADFPTPEPGPGQVLVRLRAAALNRLDLWVRAGWPGIRLEYPHIPGADGAGEIAALGEGVAGWTLGERVALNPNLGCGECDFCQKGQDNLCRRWNLLGETLPGTYAEFVCLPARQLFRLPAGFDIQTAAAAGLVYLTAWHSLVTRAKLAPGEIVLIVGASGGVNTASVQIAKYLGAQVIVVGAGREKLSLAESLGADILIDREKEPDWSKAVYAATNKQGAALVVDNVGTTFPLSLRCLSKGGRLVTVGNTGGPKFEIDNRYIFSKHISLLGSTMGTLADYQTVMSLVAARKLRVALDRSYPLRDARAAQARLEGGQQMGKITLEIP
ncbi:MAG: zinc-binding dehydrogenase [Anaerolineales bacterium]|jgi:NADPH:quinone reductase-like Zn-dependent oxidoreductase|nr:zinc-binding dehydrogenase [Anaerolineales bacterium]